MLHPLSTCAYFDACVRRGSSRQFVAAVSRFERSRIFLDLLAGACVDFAAAGLCALCDDMHNGALTPVNAVHNSVTGILLICDFFVFLPSWRCAQANSPNACAHLLFVHNCSASGSVADR